MLVRGAGGVIGSHLTRYSMLARVHEVGASSTFENPEVRRTLPPSWLEVRAET